MRVKRKLGGKLNKLYFIIWEWPEWLAQPILRVMCKGLGHQPVDDQCNKPEHRLCTWCHKRQPYAECWR